MKKSCCVWKIVVFAALLALTVGMCTAAFAEPCAPGTHKWYYDSHPTQSENYPCGSSFTITDHCTVCGEIWERTITISNHKAGSPVVTTIEPSCVSDGLKITRTFCIRCSEKMSETQEPISKLGHDWGEWRVEKPATCTEDGLEARACRRCGLRETNPLPAIGHKWDSGVITRQPDCTNEGVKLFTCQNDSSHTKTESIAVVPDAHKWDSGKVTKQPNCTEKGVRTYTCTINSAHTKTEEIPINPDAHQWDSGKITVPPECEKEGKKVYTCELNASHTKEETVPPTGHKWDKGTVTKEPTLTDTGIRHYVCENNNSHTKDETIPKITFSNNTLCAFGPRLRDVDLYPYNTDDWYMFTPIDASKDGRQTFELVASNTYIVGTVTVTIRDGKMTVDYTLNSKTIDMKLEFFTVLSKIKDITVYEPEQLMDLQMKVRQPIDLEEKFGEDRNLVLYFCSRADYTYSSNFTRLDYESAAHQRLLNDMLNMMDR